MLSHFRKVVISTFIALYIIGAGLWLLCPSPRRDDLLRPMEPVILFSGLWQAYTMFCPNPRDVNLTIEAHLTYADGTKKIWHYPQMEKLNYFERMYKERYRKYGYDHLNWDAEKVLWPDFARYIARINSSPSMSVSSIDLVRRWSVIPPANIGMGKPAPPLDKEYKFFTYQVKDGDLK